MANSWIDIYFANYSYQGFYGKLYGADDTSLQITDSGRRVIQEAVKYISEKYPGRLTYGDTDRLDQVQRNNNSVKLLEYKN